MKQFQSRQFGGRQFIGRQWRGQQVEVPSSGGGYARFRIPPDLRSALRRRVLDEDDLYLLLAACIDGNSLH